MAELCKTLGKHINSSNLTLDDASRLLNLAGHAVALIVKEKPKGMALIFGDVLSSLFEQQGGEDHKRTPQEREANYSFYLYGPDDFDGFDYLDLVNDETPITITEWVGLAQWSSEIIGNLLMSTLSKSS